MAEIRVGTASWTDPGFVEDWYPPKLPASRRLRWYSEHFDLVEVNSTFYALPTAVTVKRWCTETPDDFVFDVKLPKVLSRHSMRVQFLPPDLRSRVPTRDGVVQLTDESEKAVSERLLRDLDPLIQSGKLGVFLLQMSPVFSPRNHRLAELDSICARFNGFKLAIELRNRSWVTGTQLDRTVDYFKRRGCTFVMVDAPESDHFTVMPGVDCVTDRSLGYFRAHGRNAEGYVKGRSVAERFDYDYSPDEVRAIAERLRRVSEQVDRLHVIANNNRSNYAPKLAAALREQLGLQKALRRELSRQPTQRELL